MSEPRRAALIDPNGHPAEGMAGPQLPDLSGHLWKEAINKLEKIAAWSGMGHDLSHWDDRLFVLSSKEPGVLHFYETKSETKSGHAGAKEKWRESMNSPLFLAHCAVSEEPPKSNPDVRWFRGEKSLLNGVVLLKTRHGREYRLWHKEEGVRRGWLRALQQHTQYATERATAKPASSRKASLRSTRPAMGPKLSTHNEDKDLENERLKAQLTLIEEKMAAKEAVLEEKMAAMEAKMAAKEAAFEERMAKLAAGAASGGPSSAHAAEARNGRDYAAATHENDIDQEELSWGAVARVGEEEQEVKRRSLIGIS